MHVIPWKIFPINHLHVSINFGQVVNSLALFWLRLSPKELRGFLRVKENLGRGDMIGALHSGRYGELVRIPGLAAEGGFGVTEDRDVEREAGQEVSDTPL